MSLDSSVLSEGSVSGDQSGHEAADLTTKAIKICAACVKNLIADLFF